MFWSALCFVAATLPLCLKASPIRSSTEDDCLSYGQKNRFRIEYIPDVGTNQLIDRAYLLLEELTNLTDAEERRNAKRSFLKKVLILPSDDLSSEKGKKKKTSNVIKIAETDQFMGSITLSYPTFSEALEHCLTELTASEAAAFARTYQIYFYSAPLPVLEAIKDYSAFEVSDLAAEQIKGTLLNIESAVRTLPISCLVKSLETIAFQLSEHQQQLIKLRAAELIEEAKSNPQLIYQLVLPYVDVFGESLEAVAAKSASPVSAKRAKKKKNKSATAAPTTSSEDKGSETKEKTFEDLIPKHESPSLHPVFGELVDADRIIAMKPILSPAQWKQLVFCYGLYTNTLVENIFASVVRCYAKFAPTQFSTFVMFHRLLIDDLAKIAADRVKLLRVCSKDDNLKALLSSPLSRQVRDALEAADENTKRLVENPDTFSPQVFQQWLWAQVKEDFGKNNQAPFPFRVKSTEELLTALANCFKITSTVDKNQNRSKSSRKNDSKRVTSNRDIKLSDDEQSVYEHFRYGFMVNLFLDHLVFGETIEGDSENSRESLKGQFLSRLDSKRIETSSSPMEFPETLGPEDKIELLFTFAEAFNKYIIAFDNIVKLNELLKAIEADEKSCHFVFSFKKHYLQRIIQFSIPSDLLLDTLLRLGSVKDHSFVQVISAFPELLGYQHWEYLLSKGYCPESMVRNFTGNMISRLGSDRLNFPPLDQMIRGLYAVPVEKVKQFLRQSEFLLNNPPVLINCTHPELARSYYTDINEESIRFFHLVASHLYDIGSRDINNLWMFADALIEYHKKTKDTLAFIKYTVRFLLAIEMQYTYAAVDLYLNPSTIIQANLECLQAEVISREMLTKYIEGNSNLFSDDFADAVTSLQSYIKFGPLSSTRTSLILEFAVTVDKSFSYAIISKSSDCEHLPIIRETLTRILGNRKTFKDKPKEFLAKTTKVCNDFYEFARTFISGDELSQLHMLLASIESVIEPHKLGLPEWISIGVLEKAIANGFKAFYRLIGKITLARMKLTIKEDLISQGPILHGKGSTDSKIQKRNTDKDSADKKAETERKRAEVIRKLKESGVLDEHGNKL